jgi:hypothetical protein
MDVSNLSNNTGRSYVEEILKLVSSFGGPQDLVEAFANRSVVYTKVYYKSTDRREYPIDSVNDLFRQAEKDLKDKKRAVCVVENVSPAYIEALGNKWNLDHDFFIGHGTNTQEDKLWDRKYEWKWDPQSNIEEMASSKYGHLYGIFEYHDWKKGHASELTSRPNAFRRHCFEQDGGPIQSNSNISYYRVNEMLCE